jgi:hypothetical protein
MEDDRKYCFRREDNGEIERVAWSAMIEMDAGGYITLPDGVVAKRCRHLEVDDKQEGKRTGHESRPIVSDSLGFGFGQLAEMEQDRASSGFTDIEFRRDPQTPEFYQVHCGSVAAFDRYAKHRGFVNKSKGSGFRFAPGQLERAQEDAKRRYP